MSKHDLGRLLRELHTDGYMVRRTAGGHFAARHPRSSETIFLAATPSCPRAVANARAAIRRNRRNLTPVAP
jgi:predicted RNA binding protein YcfA (HicA-like mRNA interferase family)